MHKRGPAKQMRQSGTEYNTATKAGRAGAQHLKYKAQDPDTGYWHIDTDAINTIVQGYLANIDARTPQGKTPSYSRVGIRLALGISRDTYLLWLAGYVSRADTTDTDNIIPNTALADAMRAGDDKVIQSLLESDKKYSQTKEIRLLETMGEISAAKQDITVNGKLQWGKWGKRAE